MAYGNIKGITKNRMQTGSKNGSFTLRDQYARKINNEWDKTTTTMDPGLYELGAVPAQNNATWIERISDITDFVGSDVRFYIHYISGSSFTGDVQFDDFNIGGNVFDPEIGTNNFERSNTNTPGLYDQVSWAVLTDGTSNGFMNRDSGGTPSNSTGNTAGNTGSFYYYAETSGNRTGYPNANFWLRSPVVTVNTGILSFFSAQNGATCGTFSWGLEVL